jgi:hypothetical protein
MTTKISAHTRSHVAAAHETPKTPPSDAQIKTVIKKAYTQGDGNFNFPANLALKAVPHALLATPLAHAFKEFSGHNSSDYDYSTLNRLNLDGKTVYALESVADAVDDLRVYSARGQPLLKNISGQWSK